MVDELMLQDVKNIFKKIEVIRAREDFLLVLEELGISHDSSDEVINEAIVSRMMSEQELTLYKKYMLYSKRADIVNLSLSIDTLNELTTSVSGYYEESARNNHIIAEINKIIARVDSSLRDYPNIRVGTEYNKVKISYKKYFDAYIKSGMDRATYTEGIERIEHSSLIVRGLKKRKLKQLKEGLEVHNVDSKERIDTLYDEYISERDAYGVYLRELMVSMMKKDSMLYQVGLLSMSSMYGSDVPVKTSVTGLKTLDSKMDINITPEEVAVAAFEYFRKIDEPEFNAEMFIKSFREFLLHFYNGELKRLKDENDRALRDINKTFKRQRTVMSDLSHYRESLVIPALEQGKDEEDTFALVYSNHKINK